MIVTVEICCPGCRTVSTGTFHNPAHNLPERLFVPCKQCERHFSGNALYNYLTGHDRRRPPEEHDDDYGHTT